MKLALLGGAPVCREPLSGNLVIGAEEREAVCRVVDSGVLSGFMGSWDERFYGGPELQALEREWAQWFGVKHAVAVNSATSGLSAAVGAAGVSPGDEVIVSPYTMCASATVPLLYGAIPVFADIDPTTFCLDPTSVRERVTKRTKAIIAVDLFGHPYEDLALRQIALEHGLAIIEDTAQAPAARYHGRWAGTLGDLGVFSLNYHKHIHCGEGGIVATDNDELAERVRMIRNHAEAVVGPRGEENLINMIGFNFRMTELEAAVARCQLRKLEHLVLKRRSVVEKLNHILRDIPCLTLPSVKDGCEHSYYLHALRFDENKGGVPRSQFVKAIAAELSVIKGRESEGPIIWEGYTQPLYRLPVFQKRIAIGREGWPWSHYKASTNASYRDGSCPVAEQMYAKELFLHEYIAPFLTDEEISLIGESFIKVWECRHELQA